jgi:hypothetical protein
MTGYWIVVGTVVLAVLAVLIGLLSDLPEWQLPLRRQHPSLLYRVAPRKLIALDPSTALWEAVIRRAEPPLIEVHEAYSASGASQMPSEWQAIESAVNQRPRLMVIVGAPALVLSGRPPAEVALDIECIVSRLALSGCSSIVQGFYTPTMNEELRRSAIDSGALSRLAASWNDMLVKATERYGARVVHNPNHFQEAIKAAFNRPLARDLSVSDGPNFDRSKKQQTTAA